MAKPETILVTGATGYIGGRLVPRLVEEGRRVRVLVRSRSRALSRPWAEQVEIAVGDVLSPGTLREVLAGVDTAYYLVHSMSGGPNFHELDMRAPAPSAGPRRTLGSAGSSTWAASETRKPISRRTCAHARRRDRPCGRAECPSRSSAPP